MRTRDEIDHMIDLAGSDVNQGSVYPNMTYEEGVETALLWAIEESDFEPMTGVEEP